MPASPLLGRARELRRDQSRSEAIFWGLLRNRGLGGWKWKRQVPRGPFVLDFYCAELNLALEVDGPQHEETRAYDARRTRFLEGLGLRVVRFASDRAFDDIEALRDEILEICGGDRRG